MNYRVTVAGRIELSEAGPVFYINIIFSGPSARKRNIGSRLVEPRGLAHLISLKIDNSSIAVVSTIVPHSMPPCTAPRNVNGGADHRFVTALFPWKVFFRGPTIDLDYTAN